MKNWFAANRRLFGLLAVLLPLAGLLVLVALRAGPLAAVPVTVATVESQALAPALFGIGTVEARYTHRIGPTFAGRVATVAVQPGDAVRAGQEVGEMDPIDLDERLVAQEAGLRRAEANVLAAQAQVREVGARRSFANAQATRYARLLQSNSVSGEAAAGKRQEADGAAAAHQAATASAEAVKQELSRLRAERDALRATACQPAPGGAGRWPGRAPRRRPRHHGGGRPGRGGDRRAGERVDPCPFRPAARHRARRRAPGADRAAFACRRGGRRHGGSRRTARRCGDRGGDRQDRLCPAARAPAAAGRARRTHRRPAGVARAPAGAECRGTTGGGPARRVGGGRHARPALRAAAPGRCRPRRPRAGARRPRRWRAGGGVQPAPLKAGSRIDVVERIAGVAP